MLNQLKPAGRGKYTPSLWSVFSGIFLGITITYLLVFGHEILAGEHFLDLEFLGNLLWLGVGVVLFACYEAHRSAEG